MQSLIQFRVMVQSETVEQWKRIISSNSIN